jgi:hypothetical protein
MVVRMSFKGPGWILKWARFIKSHYFVGLKKYPSSQPRKARMQPRSSSLNLALQHSIPYLPYVPYSTMSTDHCLRSDCASYPSGGHHDLGDTV